jgi:hypothetical protein
VPIASKRRNQRYGFVSAKLRALTGERFFYLAETIMRPDVPAIAWNQADGLLDLIRSEDVSGGQLRF